MTALSSEAREAIRQRVEKATKGPWFTGPHYLADVHSREGVVRANCWNAPQAIADAEFIAHAREDIPVLLAEVERLNTKIDQRVVAIAAFETWMNIPEGGDWIDAVSAAIDRAFKNGEARGRARAAEEPK